MKKKKLILGGLAVVLVAVLLAFVWIKWCSATRIGFLHYQAIDLGQIAKANDNGFVKLEEVSLEQLDDLDDYDIVFVNGMGLRLTQEQREQIQKAADKGLPMLTTMSTNPDNNFNTLDSLQTDTLQKYLGEGGYENYRSVLNYVRRYIDKKILSSPAPKPLVTHAMGVLYHPNLNDKDGEDLEFKTVAEYRQFLQKNKLWKPNAPAVVLTGVMGDPRDLIAKLEESGKVVYPLHNLPKFLQSEAADSISPAAVVNMAHGRLGDAVVDYLAQANIPLFSPLNVSRPVEDWEQDKMGMSGGFLSQSVVTPEIDGALRPFALFAHYKGKDGVPYVAAIPERLETFVETITRYIDLKRKANQDKRVAIYYYKGPGQNALTAAGMEVVPSLYNLLKRLQQEGYNVSGLPASPQILGQMLQAQGAAFGLYAKGAFSDFMRTGKPELINKTQYESWVKQALRPEKYAEVVKANGDFPGAYMSTADGRLGVARLRFGNVVLLPQNAAGKGDNAFKIVHGTNTAPPHTYIASYLWTRFGFKADVLIHFGTHGSLEFTPHKQVALSSLDWPDRLVGPLPHFYIYSIGNVGESLIAKRRSYAGLISYLTPPFLESNTRSIYQSLEEKIKIFNARVADGNKAAIDRASLDVKALAIKLGIQRELELDADMKKPYTEDEILRIDNYAEEIATSKIIGQPYTLGVPYEPQRIQSSIFAMCTDPIAYSLLALDKMRGKADDSALKHNALFTQRYLNPARALVGRILTNPAAANDALICNVAHITPAQLQRAHTIYNALSAPSDRMAMMMGGGGSGKPNAKMMQAMQAMMKQAKLSSAQSSKHAAQPSAAQHKQKSSKARQMMEKMAKEGGKPDAEAMKAMHEMAAKGEKPSPEALAMMRAMAAKGGAPDPEAMKAMKAMMSGGETADAKETATQHASSPTAAKAHPAKVSKSSSRSQVAAAKAHSTTPRKQKPNTSAPSKNPSAMMAAMMKASQRPKFTKQEKDFAYAVMEVERTIKNIQRYKQALFDSPQMELNALLNAMSGGYTKPSPGGDPIVNPNTLPTGRNLFGINAENTPSESAWEKGKELAENTISLYRKRHKGEYPRKVSYTLWSGEFIETEGATIAQVLYMLGVEPIRDSFGRVTDLRLIPSRQLGRPRIDVVVQTSGQLRDLAASRLFLINRAVEMAAAAKDEAYTNQVAAGVVEAERTLTKKGVSPKAARAMATRRVFGGVNGGYGTGIQAMVMSSDRWEKRSEIADTYINNMGAFYGDEKEWEAFDQFAFEAALTRTDVVIQPRQSNTWGALSLDHVYEFMGGLNLAVKQVTGKEPDAYLSDYRNHNRMRMQEVKEAIGVESRTTLFNPTYIKEQMKGEASAANGFAELVQNTFGWEVMKPGAIDEEMWTEIFDVYAKDKFNLGLRKYFEERNPAALEEISAVMLEAARKGMWKADAAQVAELAKLHTDLVNKYKPSCSGFVCDNAKLRDFIASKTDAATAKAYKANIDDIRAAKGKDGKVLKKEDLTPEAQKRSQWINGALMVGLIIVIFGGLLWVVRRNRKHRQ